MKSARRLLCVAALAAAALVAVSVVPASGAQRCAPKGAKTKAKNSKMRVFALGGKVYGCLISTGKAVPIVTGGSVEGFTIRPLVLTRGLFVGFSDNELGEDSVISTVSLYNLKTGKRAYSKQVAQDGARVPGMVVNGKGSMAWMEDDPDDPPQYPTTVVAFDSQGRRTLDSSFAINTRSLRMSSDGTRVNWTNGSEQKSASVSP
jgi:hypothetical protein